MTMDRRRQQPSNKQSNKENHLFIANLKIGTRLMLGFAIVLALMLGLVTIGINSMERVHGALDHVLHNNVPKMELLNDMSKSVHIVSRVMRSVIILTDEAAMAREYKKIEAARHAYDAAREALEKMPASEAGKAERAKIAALQAIARPLNSRVTELALANKNTEAMDLLMKQAAPATQKWLEALDEDIDRQKGNNQEDGAAAQDTYTQARIVMFSLTSVALALGMLLAWLVTRSITGPITEAVRVAQTVAAGDLTSRIEVTSRDETGQLLQALKEMNDSLKTIVGEVRAGTETIATASTQIASGNMDLSSRTEQQASSLEETASSMEELTSTVKQNGSNAHQANQLAASASEVAVAGGQVVSQVVVTMGAINESAKKIVDIIGVIDGIAFQTNILALNAAVEAARAGEQGRGFAVVATEVRNLAQRSAGAAKEIKALIDDSVEKVGAGSRLVNQAGVTMAEIVTSVKRVADIMAEISSAGREQEAGIEQINVAITEMDTVTQQNAALVEQAAAAAESLQDQAGALARVVGVFKLDGAPRPIAAAPSRTPRMALASAPAGVPKRAMAKFGAGRSAQAQGRARAADAEWETF
jgi:methyl-accepting chemotaxis protein